MTPEQHLQHLRRANEVGRAAMATDSAALALAAELDWDAALVWVDERQDYGECRVLALAPQTETLFCVAFVDRGEVRRVISLRRANRREVKRYVQFFAEDEQVRSHPNANPG